jgi:hypothetical protein
MPVGERAIASPAGARYRRNQPSGSPRPGRDVPCLRNVPSFSVPGGFVRAASWSRDRLASTTTATSPMPVRCAGATLLKRAWRSGGVRLDGVKKKVLDGTRTVMHYGKAALATAPELFGTDLSTKLLGDPNNAELSR